MDIARLKKQSLPDIYIRNNRKCYLDPVREKLIYITPEETVRQKVIAYLIQELHVPQNMIVVEEPLSHYQIQTKRRADIVIHKYNGELCALQPLAVIECKAPEVLLGDKAVEHMTDYSNMVGSEYSVLTNGEECFAYYYNCSEQKYVRINGLPPYEDMLGAKYDSLPSEPVPERIPFSQILDKLDVYAGYDIGANSSPELQAVAVNLLECYLDTDYQMPTGKYKTFRLIEDFGVRLLEYGNASGGVHSGPYRSFLIDYQGSTEFVSIGVAPYVTWAHQDVQKTVINVAVDDEKSAHHSLQLVLDDNLIINGKKCIFRHHGRIGVGNIGSGKVEELKNFLREQYPDIVRENRIVLGSLENSDLWNLNQPEVIRLTENLISYALIRDEYRKCLKKRKME